MPDKGALHFLKQHHPFSQLDDNALSALVQCLALELYPPGARILAQGDRTAHALYIVKEGSVAIAARSGPDQERTIDYRGVGETFGFLSLEEGGRLDVTVRAAVATTCYVAEHTCIMKLLSEHPALGDDLIPSYFPGMRDDRRIYPSGSNLPRDGSDRALFTTPIKELASRDVVTAPPGLSVIESVGIMTARRVSSLVIVDKDGGPVGIVTNTDLRDRAMARRADLAAPVSGIMSAPVLTVDGNAFCYEALLKMSGHNVNHLIVTEAGRLYGVISTRDLMALQTSSPLMLVRDIEKRSTVEGVAEVSGRVLRLISLLLREGAKARHIIRIISDVNDRIERKLLDLAAIALGPPPVAFCWIVYGSAGRMEQAFRTDQDNAIVYADPVGEEMARQADEYFKRFAEYAVNAFRSCGFTLCPGDFMATNPQWRQPLSAWKRSFSSWAHTPTDAAVHNAVNLFDFRGLAGDLPLALDLKEHLMRSLAGKPFFLKAVANLITEYRPPIGMFGSLVVEKTGEHANLLDIKKSCLTPITNIVRLAAFEAAIPETSTFERLGVLKHAHPVMRDVGDDLEHALEFLMLLRIRHQSEQASLGAVPDNHLNPAALSSFERGTLRDICKLVSRLLNEIAARYEVGMHL